MKLKKSNNDPAGILVKRAMDFTVQIASLAWTASLRGLHFMEAAMQTKNQGQTICSELTDIEIQAKRWEQRQVQIDSQRFRGIVSQARQRLGLESLSSFQKGR